MKWKKMTRKQLEKKYSSFYCEVMNSLNPLPDAGFFKEEDIIVHRGKYYIVIREVH